MRFLITFLVSTSPLDLDNNNTNKSQSCAHFIAHLNANINNNDILVWTQTYKHILQMIVSTLRSQGVKIEYILKNQYVDWILLWIIPKMCKIVHHQILKLAKITTHHSLTFTLSECSVIPIPFKQSPDDNGRCVSFY